MVKDYSLKYLTTEPSVKQKIEIIKNWVERYGRIWSRRVLYELVSNQLVKDTSDTQYKQTCKLFQNLREQDIIPYDWFKDKRTTVENLGIKEPYGFQERFDILCDYYTKSSKSLQKYYVEVWTEKELPEVTQDLLSDYDVALVMGEGFIGDIPFHDAINRMPKIIDENNIPIKIIYISDFDCEGEHTFQLCKDKLELFGYVEVKKLFLTGSQIKKYNYISNIGYEDRIRKMSPKQKKAHLTKQYVKDFFNENGIVQYELDQVPVDLLNETLENTISSYIDKSIIENTHKICRREVKNWLEEHYIS